MFLKTFFKSLAFRVLALSIILLALPLFIDSFILLREKYKDLFASAKIYLVEINKEKEAPLVEMLENRKAMIPLLVHYLKLEDKLPDKGSDELNEKFAQVAAHGDFTAMYLVRFDDHGAFSLVASARPSVEQATEKLFPIYRFYSESGYQSCYFSTIFYNADTAQYELLLSMLLHSKDDHPTGFLTFSYDLTASLKRILTQDVIPYPVQFALLLPSQTVVAATESSLLLQSFALSTANRLKKENAHKHRLRAQKYETLTGIEISYDLGYPYIVFEWQKREQIGTLLPIANTGFYLLAFAAKEDILSKPMHAIGRIYLAYAMILLIGGIITTFLAWRFARPLNRLIETMKQIQQGHLQARYEKDPLGFEINALGATFNLMIDSLFERKQKAETERVKQETWARELRIGRSVQRSLLPAKMPAFKGVEISERYLPAKEVAGDFYDLFVRGPVEKSRDSSGNLRRATKELVMMIADASGKGIQACFYSLGVRSSARAFAREFEDPAQIMKSTNVLFCEDSGASGMFVTAVMGIYDADTKIFKYYSCGHNPLILRRKNGEIIKLANEGMALGFQKELPGETQSIELEEHDLLVFYTDGITEALNEKEELFGEERLINFLKNYPAVTTEELASALLDNIKKFCGAAAQADDITLLMIKII